MVCAYLVARKDKSLVAVREHGGNVQLLYWNQKDLKLKTGARIAQEINAFLARVH